MPVKEKWPQDYITAFLSICTEEITRIDQKSVKMHACSVGQDYKKGMKQSIL